MLKLFLISSLFFSISLNAPGEINKEVKDEKIQIVLDEPFSSDGLSTDIIRDYKTDFKIPTAKAYLGKQEVEVETEVKYLGIKGWMDQTLNTERTIKIGDVPGEDKYAVSLYSIKYISSKNDIKSELNYRIYAGLQMFLTINNSMVGFLNEDIVLPTFMPTYRYLKENGRNGYIDVTKETNVYFQKDGETSVSKIGKDLKTVKPTLVGKYILEFVAMSANKDGVNYIGTPYKITKEIKIKNKRSNPLVEANGVYKQNLKYWIHLLLELEWLILQSKMN